MRRKTLGLLGTALVVFATLIGASEGAGAAPELPAGPMGEHLAAYVAAVNHPDLASATQFSEKDLSPSLGQLPGAVLRFFESQRRVTGGIQTVGFRFEDSAQKKGVLVFKDGIYGSLRAIAFTFDGAPDRRIEDITFVAAPDWSTASLGKLTEAEVAARANARIDRGCRADVFSGAFLVAHEGRVLVEHACGEANKRYHAANDVETRFNIASMNKMFTAVAAAQLIEQGRLKLTDPLSVYLDDSWLPKPLLDQITVGELFSMTSGLQNFFDTVPFASFQMNRTLDAYKPLMHGLKSVSRPGEKYAYSDTAYFLLGVVIEKASGEDYYDYVRRHIYGPAGMNATDSYPLDGTDQNLATGYVYRAPAKAWFANLTGVMLRGGPAGGGYSTVGDLYRFSRALTSGKLIRPSSLELLFKDHRPPSGTGFFVMDTPAGRIVGKDGFGSGISAEMDLFIDSGWLVVSLSNYDDGARAPLEATRTDILAAR